MSDLFQCRSMKKVFLIQILTLYQWNILLKFVYSFSHFWDFFQFGRNLHLLLFPFNHADKICRHCMCINNIKKKGNVYTRYYEFRWYQVTWNNIKKYFSHKSQSLKVPVTLLLQVQIRFEKSKFLPNKWILLKYLHGNTIHDFIHTADIYSSINVTHWHSTCVRLLLSIQRTWPSHFQLLCFSPHWQCCWYSCILRFPCWSLTAPNVFWGFITVYTFSFLLIIDIMALQ